MLTLLGLVRASVCGAGWCWRGMLAVAYSALASVSVAQPSQSQSAVASSACVGCTLELAHVARLGAATDPDIIGRLMHVAVDSRGKFAAENATGDGVLIFDKSGRYSRRVGTRGSGPGELSMMFDIMFGPGDSLWVMNGPFAIVYSPTFSFVRSTRRPAQQWGAAVPLGDGTLVSASMTGVDPSHLIFLSRNANQKPLLVDEGREAFHPPGERFPTCSACLVPALAAGLELNTFWSLNPNSYRVRQWTSTGVVLRDFTVSSPRFPAFGDDNRGDPAASPLRPLIHSLGVAADGTLLVAGETSSTNWKRPPRATRSEGPRRKG